MYTERLHEAIMFATIAHKSQTRKGSTELKAIIFADKLSNILSLYDDYKFLGDGVFEKFNAGKEQQTWYYGELLDAFIEGSEDLSLDLVTQFRDVYNKIFLS